MSAKTAIVVAEFDGPALLALHGPFPSEGAAEQFIDLAIVLVPANAFQLCEVTDPRVLLSLGDSQPTPEKDG